MPIESVDDFKYLGLVINRANICPTTMLEKRILKAQAAFNAIKCHTGLLGLTEEFVFNLYNLWQFLLLCMEEQFLVVWDQRVCNCMVVHRCTCALKCFYGKCLDGHCEQQLEIHAVAYYF